MEIQLYQIDAFTNVLFSGNPAAVCVLDSWLDDEIMQHISSENNLSETAFIVRSGNCFDLRWFTPTTEIDLCGHATLASAFVIFNFIDTSLQRAEFMTKSGLLVVDKKDDLLEMDFPSLKVTKSNTNIKLSEALGVEPVEFYKSTYPMVIYESESQIKGLNPDLDKLKMVEDCLGVITTAPGDSVDFVSRFFAPRLGIDEDPVTGSAHCALVPYWSERLDKSILHAWQVSKRRGELFCENKGERIKMSGNAVLYLKGVINL
ncbi:PhzF family phenazine biosynthesis protein [bacterium]|nr:PhzF family phenazine biosynthesis protein [bacterium]